MRRALLEIYNKLYRRFGPQKWWPGDTPFEIIVGAILTQNTNWANVERAINNLKNENLLSPRSISKSKIPHIAKLIRPSGYYNIKARRLRNFLDFLNAKFDGDLKRLLGIKTKVLRSALLKVGGIGPETADSILLYAANRPVFVIDAYTKRVFVSHGLIKESATYDQIQDFFMANLPRDAKLYNEYHALIVRVGKEFCKKPPKCRLCPLRQIRKTPHRTELSTVK